MMQAVFKDYDVQISGRAQGFSRSFRCAFGHRETKNAGCRCRPRRNPRFFKGPPSLVHLWAFGNLTETAKGRPEV